LEPSINGLLNVIDKVSAERDSNIKKLIQCLDKDIADLGRELKEIKSQANVREFFKELFARWNHRLILKY